MDSTFLILVVLCVLVLIGYFLSHGKRGFLERRMSTSVQKVHRFFDDTGRRVSQFNFTSLPTTLKRRLSKGGENIRISLSRRLSQMQTPESTERRAKETPDTENVISKCDSQSLCGPISVETTDTVEKAAKVACLETDHTSNEEARQPDKYIDEISPQEDLVAKIMKSINLENDYAVDEDRTLPDKYKSEVHSNLSLTPICEDDDERPLKQDPTSDASKTLVHAADVANKDVVDSSETSGHLDTSKGSRQANAVPTGYIVPTIKLDNLPGESSPDQASKGVSFVSNEEVISPVSIYNTVSPRRVSLKPGSVPFRQVASKRGSVMLPATTVSPASKGNTLLVQPQGYICPRRTSVLFSSDIFAHSPRRKSSTCGRVLHIPETAPTQSKRFFLPRKSVIKNVIRSSWSAVTGPTNGGSNLRSGIRATTSCTGSYYPHRRRSSVGFSKDIKPEVSSKGFVDKLPSLTDISGSISRRKSMLKKIVKAPFQSAMPTECPRTEGIHKRRESRAGLAFFRRQSMFGRRQSTHIPKQKGNYITGNLTEFKTVFGPNAHEVLTEKFKTHGPLYEITALGQRTVFLFDHKDIEEVKKAEGKYPKHMDFKHLRLYRQRNDLPLGLLLSNGEEWKQQRRVMSKMFLGAVPMARYVPIIDKVASSSIDIISQNLPSDCLFLPEEDIGNYVIEAFGRILYGRDLHCLEKGQENELHQFVKTAKSNFNDAKKLLILPTCLMLLHPAWRRQNERWNSLLETTVHQVRQSTDPGQKRNSFSIISQIFSSGEMTEPEMLVNLTDLLLASIDTTSNVILWCLYELSRNPEAQDKIFGEFKQSGCPNNSLKFQDLKELTYLKAVVKETLRWERNDGSWGFDGDKINPEELNISHLGQIFGSWSPELHPVGFLTCRTISNPMTIRQYNVPQKSTVAAAMYVMGRNSNLTADPDKFIPERWLASDPVLESFYNVVPFGFGPRACLGRRVAEIEISLFILHFCRKFQFRMKNSEVIEHNIKLLLVPAKPLELIVEHRTPCES